MKNYSNLVLSKRVINWESTASLAKTFDKQKKSFWHKKNRKKFIWHKKNNLFKLGGLQQQANQLFKVHAHPHKPSRHNNNHKRKKQQRKKLSSDFNALTESWFHFWIRVWVYLVNVEWCEISTTIVAFYRMEKDSFGVSQMCVVKK